MSKSSYWDSDLSEGEKIIEEEEDEEEEAEI